MVAFLIEYLVEQTQKELPDRHTYRRFLAFTCMVLYHETDIKSVLHKCLFCFHPSKIEVLFK